jgi:GT2 family glycosyltransferase
MIRFVTPYSFNKRLFEAMDAEMKLSKPGDWLCFMDGDAAFLTPKWGHTIKEYIDRYPDTGIFTCYASRCHYQRQVPYMVDIENDSLLYHSNIAATLQRNYHLEVQEMTKYIAGHLMVISRNTWDRIRNRVEIAALNKNILGVDTKISNAVLLAGLKIRLMKGVYIFHYLRLLEGFRNDEHLR